MKNLYELIIEAFPALADNFDVFVNGTITLQNDADEKGDYIAAWNYSEPLPKNLESYLK
jgi:hypothetical protein